MFKPTFLANMSIAQKGKLGSRKPKTAETKTKMRIAAAKREQEKRSAKNAV